MKNTQNKKVFASIHDEQLKLKEKDILGYFKRYFNNDEMNKIDSIYRYYQKNYWEVILLNSRKRIIGRTLKDLVINLMCDESILMELNGGQY